MSERPPAGDEFWDLADSFIELANQHLDKHTRGRVSASLFMVHRALPGNAALILRKK